LNEQDFLKVGDFIDRGVKIAQELNAVGENSKKLVTFKEALRKREHSGLKDLMAEVNTFASKFHMP